MEEVMEYIIIGLLVVLVVLMLFLLFSTSHKKSDSLDLVQRLGYFETNITKDMASFKGDLGESLHKDFTALNEKIELRLNQINDRVNERLDQNFEKTNKTFTSVLERLSKIDEAQKKIDSLSNDIISLQSILTDKKTRGIFGEIELYSLLETAMGVNTSRYAKQYKLSNGAIADAVLFGKEPLHMICIDSKFPLENYNRIMAAQTKEEQQKYHTIFVNDVKKHIKAIAQKYILPQETADFAYLFLPAEAVFAYLYAQCDEVVNYSYQEKVYMVSPTTLMAYITAIKAIYLGVERNENLAQMQKELQKLEMEFERFAKRYQNVQSDFDKCYQDMRLLSITANKLHMRFQEIQAVELTKKDTA